MGEHLKRLKELRQKKGVLQKDVSEFLGISVQAYSLYETGTREPNISTLQRLSSYFGVSVDYLLGIEEAIPQTIAAHFDGDEYTPDELERIKEFAAFVKATRKPGSSAASAKPAPVVPVAPAQVLNAAHVRTDIEVTDEMRQHDEDIMNDDSEWE